MDIQAAKEHGVIVTNTPGVNAEAVGELAFGLLLAVARKIPKLDQDTRAGGWMRSTGFECLGKTICILGLGAIGKVVARCAKGFGMKVCAYDPYINEAYCEQNDIQVVSFEEGIAMADVVSLHLPLMESTRYIIDEKAIASMKDGAVLINASRGGLIDEKAAYEVPNQYSFGSELTVCPITSPQHKELNLGSVEVWLPEGRYTDVFTGKSYRGNKKITMFRELETIPVLAEDGAIIPLSSDKGNTTENPESLEIWAVSGNSSFTLVEDNGKTNCESHTAETKLEISFENGRLTFTVGAAEGDLSVLPKKRNYLIKVLDVNQNGEAVVFEISSADINKAHTFTADGVTRNKPDDIREDIICMLTRWQAGTELKRAAFKPFEKAVTVDDFEKALKKAILPKVVSQAVREIIEIYKA